uniref:hypothetical protein n=1 Tax=uncultured Nocardioides sp. TaxID=198441 RepID=UPI00262A24EE
MRFIGRVGVRRTTAALLSTVVLAGLAACSDEPSSSRPPLDPDPVASPVAEDQLTLAVWGSRAEIDTYERLMAEYSVISETSDVEVVAFSDREEAMAALAAGEVDPDVFMASRRD